MKGRCGKVLEESGWGDRVRDGGINQELDEDKVGVREEGTEL